MMTATPSTHVPIRTCVGCRKKVPKDCLLRIVFADAVAVVDEQKRMPGRGAYLCRQERCFLRAEKSGALHRAFRRIPLRGGNSLSQMWGVGNDTSPGAGMTKSTLEGVRQR